LGGRILFGYGITDAARQRLRQRDVPVFGQFDKAVGKVGIAFGQRGLDVVCEKCLVIPLSRFELDIGDFHRIILCGQHGCSLARMRPQQRTRKSAQGHATESRADSRWFHPENIELPAAPNMVCRF
jgi:hypothetical protein